MEELDNSVNSFVKRADSDLITYYARNSKAKLDAQDVKLIIDLVDYFRSNSTDSKRNSLVVLLHTLGGNINAAIGLMDYLKSEYSTINSIVFKVAKSSGAFVALSSKPCFMYTGSVLSDFTLDPDMEATKEYTEAQRRSMLLAFEGVCGLMDSKYWVQRFVLNPNHGAPILKQELLDQGKGGVQRVSEFPSRTKALGYVHNEIVNSFKKPGNPFSKIIGYNDYFLGL